LIDIVSKNIIFLDIDSIANRSIIDIQQRYLSETNIKFKTIFNTTYRPVTLEAKALPWPLSLLPWLGEQSIW